jgi:hypothetical protein
LSVPKSLQGYINPDDLGPYTIKDLVIEEQQVVSSGKPDTVCSAQIIPAGRGWPGVIEAWEGIQLDWIGAFEFKGHGPCSGQYHIDVVNGSLLGAFYCPHLGEMQLTLLDSSDTTFPRYMNFASLHANDPFRVAVEQANDELLRREEQFVTTGGKVVGIVVLGGALFIITPGLPDEVLLLAALKGATSLPKDPGGSEANLCVGFPPQ